MDRCPQCRQMIREGKRKPPTRVNGTTRAEDRKARLAARKAETAALREAVFRRAGNGDEASAICELCAVYAATELHHLEGGSGRRREQQSEENTVAVCIWCHRKWHRDGAKAFVWSVRAWAERHGYGIPKSIGARA